MRRGQILLGSTIGFGVLYLAGVAALGTPPDSGDDGRAVVAWFRDNGGHVRLWLWFLVLAMPLFATFVALVRAQLPKVFADVFLFGAIAFAAETAVQGWIWVGLAWHPEHLAPDTARTLLDIASLWGPVLTSTTVLTLAPIALLGWRGRAGIPRWVGIVSAVALAEQLVETITVFGQHGFLAPGGPMNVYLGAGLTAIAWLSLGIALARTAPDATAAG